MNSNFNKQQGYLVSKDEGGKQTFLTRVPASSGGSSAIGQGGSSWTPEPTIDSLFSKEEGTKLSSQHNGKLIPVSVEMQVDESVSA